MDRKLVNELAITIEKVNYLFRNVRKREEDVQRIELALLKKYVTELYDGLLQLEHTIGTKTSTVAPSETPAKKVETPIAVVKNAAKDVLATSINTAKSFVDNTVNAETDSIPVQITIPPPPAVEKAPIDEMETVVQQKEVIEEMVMDSGEAVRTQVLDLTGDDIGLPADEETIAVNYDEVLTHTKPKEEASLNDRYRKSNESESPFQITLNQRVGYIKALFNEDEDAYEEAIYELGRSRGYIEALTYVNLNLRYDYRWNDDDPTVKEFLEMIKNKFLG